VSARRVAITGIGVTTGYGRGVDALWSGLASGRSAVRRHEARMGGANWVSHPMAALPKDAAAAAELPNPRFIAENRLHEDPDLLSIADCIQQAIGDAGLEFDPAHNELGLIVTHESPGLAPHVQSFFRWRELGRAWLGSRARFNPPEFLYEQQRESVYRLHSFLYVHYLSAVFGLHGFTLYNNNACASGAFALAVAADRIKNSDADTVIVAGGDIPEDGTKYRWFRDRGLYSPSGRCRPFAVERDGLVLGSGAAAFVLQDLERATSSGRRVYAEWLGGGFSSDGWKVTVPDVAGRRYAQAIARALRAAHVAPEEITMISPHGVGASLLDRYEAEALAEVFGHVEGDWPVLFPLKGAVGHTLGGCALVETVGALLALGRGQVPAVAGVDGFDPALPLKRSSRTIDARAFTLLKCVNGFGGQNGAFVLRSNPS
jgi:3-oxoacyl-[acyl-carrier-protein] synthase II